MNYPLVIAKFRDVIQDSSWDGPDKVNCPTVTSVGWLVDHSDPVKIAGTLDDENNPCVIRVKPESTFETPPRHVYNPNDVDSLAHSYGTTLDWNAG